MYSFVEYLTNYYPHESIILQRLPMMSSIEQAELDIKLLNDLKNDGQFDNNFINQDEKYKKLFIQIMKGVEKRPEIIRQTIDNIEIIDVPSHYRQGNKVTGSSLWHEAWIKVYRTWLKLLKEKLHGITQGHRYNSF